MEIQVTAKQEMFLDAAQDEVFYGGAAGGGKSYAQLIDSLLYASQYPGSKQLLLRRTFPELERSLILVSVTLYPRELAKYNAGNHKWLFRNGSMIEFGYCDRENDVTKYQSAEYDMIRFDELTHFTEFQYTYLISRLRGANDFPKQLKSTGNPGGVGHAWVKGRFIDNHPPGQPWTDETGRTRIFIPSKVQENTFLMQADPGYISRLEQLPEDERRALLDGDWDVFKGQYYPEFRREIHVIKPIELPDYWRRFRSLDYGLDMTACYWWAVDLHGKCYIYRELHQPGLNLSQAAQKIVELTPEGEEITYTVASPDLWNRRQETGESGMEIMTKAGLTGLRKANNSRVQGWRILREYLTPYQDEQDIQTARLQIFDICTNLIRCLPLLQHDEHNPEDAADSPHEVTHGPESIRYGVFSRPPITRKTGIEFPPGVPESEKQAIIENMEFAKQYEKWQDER